MCRKNGLTATVTMEVTVTSTMTTTMTEEAVRTITVKFISEGRRSASAAFYATGRNQESGEITVGVGLRQRHNAFIEVSFDLWRIGFDLSPETINRLEQQWLSLCASLPRSMQRKIGSASFGRCFSTFHIPIEQAGDWRGFLTELLSDPASYVDIRLRKSP